MGDVIKESVNIALTVATNFLTSNMPKLMQSYDKSSLGLHIHAPEGAIYKVLELKYLHFFRMVLLPELL